MQSLGVIEDGFTFTEAEIQRASPRFWWGARKRAAFARVLEQRGIAPRDRDRDEGSGPDNSSGTSDRRDTAATGAAAATVAMAETFPEKRLEGGGSWFSGAADGGGGTSDGGTSSSDSGGSGGGSGE